MSYYLYSSSVQETYGPYSANEIRSMMAAGSASAEDYVSEDGQNWTGMQEWMRLAPAEKPTSSKSKKRRRPHASKSNHGHRPRHSGGPAPARRKTLMFQLMLVFVLLAMVGVAVWLYLEAENKNEPATSGIEAEGGEQSIYDLPNVVEVPVLDGSSATESSEGPDTESVDGP
jgi:cytoskeletal protein RodZ